MINGLIPTLGAGAISSGMNQTTNNYGANPDGTFDPVGYGGGLAGLVGGAGLGAMAGRSLSNKYALQGAAPKGFYSSNTFKSMPKDKQKLMKKTNLTNVRAAQKAEGSTAKLTAKKAKKAIAKTESTGLKALMKEGKGGFRAAIAENPKLAMGGGAAVGAFLGSKLLGGNLTADSHAQQTAQMQNYATKDAYNQQSDNLAIQNGSRISF